MKKAAIPGSHYTNKSIVSKIMVGSGGLLNISLLPIDEGKSRREAEKVLDRYREVRGMLNMPINPRITSSWRDGLPASTTEHDPYPLARVQQQRWAKNYLKYCDRCIRSLPKISHQRLLRARYCDGPESDHPDLTAMTNLGIASSTYFNRKADALLAVAFYLDVVVQDD